MSADTAPAAMPGERDVALAIKRAQMGDRAELSKEGPWLEFELQSARAALALFAPILAEKERARFVGLMTGPDPAKVWKAQAYKMADIADAAEARALAAEANFKTIAQENQDLIDKLEAAEAEIERMKEMRKRLDRRIHCQRKANRDNWEIVESRRKWLGSQTAQRAWLLQRDRRLAAEAALAAEKERCASYLDRRAAFYRSRADEATDPALADERMYGAEACENAAAAIRAQDVIDIHFRETAKPEGAP